MNMPELIDAVENVEQAVKDLEQTVKDKWSTARWVGALFLYMMVSGIFSAVWHSKIRYAVEYGVGTDKITVEKISPSESCAFLAAPIGEKYCHHDWEVLVFPDWADYGKAESVYVNQPRVVEQL